MSSSHREWTRAYLLLATLLSSACAGAAPPLSPAKPPIPANEDIEAPEVSPSPAQTLLDKTLEGFGGAERVDRLRTLVVESTLTRAAPSGQQTQIRQRSYVEFPDRFRHETVLEGMTVVSVIAPGGSYVFSPLGTLPLPEEERVEIERGLARSPLALLKGRRHESFTALAEGEGEIDGRTVKYLRILYIGDSNRLAIDAETGNVLELAFIDKPLGAAGEDARDMVIRYDDYRTIDGLTYPFRSLTTREGEAAAGRTVESLQVDVELDPSLFQPPDDSSE